MVGTSSKIFDSILFLEGVLCNIHVVYSLVLTVGILQNHFCLLVAVIGDVKLIIPYIMSITGIDAFSCNFT